jgi:hypothetical protein
MRIQESTIEISKRKIIKAFPVYLSSDVQVVIDFLMDKNMKVHPSSEHHVILDGEKLSIPARVYFDKPNESTGNNLSELQQTILNCLYLRHHNGFVRQARLEFLRGKTDYFIIPFIFQLLGEYVREILIVVDDFINEETLPSYLKFKMENPKYWYQTEGRMISYWNEYYRRDANLREYIGTGIFKRMK